MIASQTLDSVQLTFGDRRIPVTIGVDCAAELVDRVVELGVDRIVIVTDDTVQQYGSNLIEAFRRRVPTLVLSAPAGESMKTTDVLASHLNAAIEGGLTKRSGVVALGGGVPGNLAGMVAALLFRGVRLVHIPTNLAAATDSVLSLKQAVNSDWGKNQIGTYYEPSAILIDLAMFATQSAREVRAGMCEALKNALAVDPSTLSDFEDVQMPRTAEEFRWLLDNCVAAKSLVMREDPREKREALALEYGHTIGHAVELCGREKQGADELSHGECIAFGMVAAARIAQRLGFLDDETVRLHERLVARVGASTSMPADVRINEVVAYVRRDNKRGIIPAGEAEVPMVILESIGKPLTTGRIPLVAVPLEVIVSTLEEFQRERGPEEV